jgi:hypothetical protein
MSGYGWEIDLLVVLLAVAICLTAYNLILDARIRRKSHNAAMPVDPETVPGTWTRTAARCPDTSGPERGEDSGQLVNRLLGEADVYERLGIIEDLPSLLREAATALQHHYR